MNQNHLDIVKQYYGKTLSTTKDLKSKACCSGASVPQYAKKILSDIHPEVLNRFYGCGSPIPLDLEGKTVVDLGCGTGRDCFIFSKLVGPQGKVFGVDMVDEQLAIANQYIDYHMKTFGFSKPNISFLKGYIEDLNSIGIEKNSVDVITSNCVINLSPDKTLVFSDIFRALRPGGELYFSDIFSGKRIPSSLTKDPLLVGECLGGALYIEDFRRLLLTIGIPDYRILSKSKVELDSPEIESKVGNIDFYSMTVRAFKLDDLEDRCEDYGQIAYYLGTIPEAPHFFTLDDHHVFEKHKALAVCSNTASMVQNTRYSRHFNVMGDTSTHFGLFPCSTIHTEAVRAASSPSGACC